MGIELRYIERRRPAPREDWQVALVKVALVAPFACMAVGTILKGFGLLLLAFPLSVLYVAVLRRLLWRSDIEVESDAVLGTDGLLLGSRFVPSSEVREIEVSRDVCRV